MQASSRQRGSQDLPALDRPAAGLSASQGAQFRPRAGSPDNRAARPGVGHRRRRYERERGARQARQAQEGGVLHTCVCYEVLSGLFTCPAGCVSGRARKIKSLDRQSCAPLFSVFAGGDLRIKFSDTSKL